MPGSLAWHREVSPAGHHIVPTSLPRHQNNRQTTVRQGDLSQRAVCPLSTFPNSGQSTQPSFLQPLLPCGWWRRGLLSSFPRHGPFSDLSDFQSQAGPSPQSSCLHTRVLRLQACTSIWPGIPAPHLSDTSIPQLPSCLWTGWNLRVAQTIKPQPHPQMAVRVL